MRAPVNCRGPVGLTRRNMLQIGAIGALDLTLPRLLAAGERASPGGAAGADSCILVFLNGGPSHLDTWDMKPDLPKEMRSEFRPVATSVPGVQVCEHLPRLSRLTSHCTLVRSVHHDQVAHAPAVYTALTGVSSNVRAGIVGAKPTDHPAIGSVVGHHRPPAANVVPYALLPHLTAEGAGGPPQPGFLGGWLGKTHDPFLVLKGGPDPDGFDLPALTPGAGVTAARVRDRAQLLAGVNRADAVRAAPADDLERLQARACDLLASPAAQRAFRIDRESPKVRDAYGRNIYGQSLLLARRLVEAGTRLACVSWAPDANATWDTHGDNFGKLKNQLLPPFDLGFSALLSDLTDRGLLDRTLVVVMGEIGRTPKINGGGGRDHWEFCYSVLFAGGGTKGGFVYGASDKRGAYPSECPVTAADVVATIYHAMGIDPALELRDRLGRPIPLVPQGTPIRGVFA
ncbi:DUF1501 domain-containing protein [Limnoglobus roseus]|uniref:DUF1501 domain-containing protein n=1 Tax=Limnoglobus roseus TaxID=2598579 RepID=A0A5C1AP06_9BACT|nr:DUF1501 domain-containing protein [Limnoglobus roseus]QEL20730.1 hypothetical protein PX52LOC_07840 [Limnoglobus roseus]